MVEETSSAAYHCFSHRPNRFLKESRNAEVKPGMLVMDSMRPHITDMMKRISSKNCIPLIILSNVTKTLWPFKISVKSSFEVVLRCVKIPGFRKNV